MHPGIPPPKTSWRALALRLLGPILEAFPSEATGRVAVSPADGKADPKKQGWWLRLFEADGSVKFLSLSQAGSFRSRIARVFRLGEDSAGFASQVSLDGSTDDEVVRGLAASGDAELQIALLGEALDLLEEADARVIRSRLGALPGTSPAMSEPKEPLGTAEDYARAADRFARRLGWVASREAIGTSPSQRRALGQVRFLGKSAQEVADLLRLPPEVVAFWVRQGDLSTATP